MKQAGERESDGILHLNISQEVALNHFPLSLSRPTGECEREVDVEVLLLLIIEWLVAECWLHPLPPVNLTHLISYQTKVSCLELSGNGWDSC